VTGPGRAGHLARMRNVLSAPAEDAPRYRTEAGNAGDPG
jgi:hypothetical protein